LSTHTNRNIAAKAIGSLRRFPFSEVKDIVDKHLYGDHPQLQSWALEVLVGNGEVVHLIRSAKFPKKFFTPTAHNLLKAVRRYHIAEGLPLMDRIFTVLKEDQSAEDEFFLALDLAGTYYFMGQKEKQAEIIAWYFDGTRFLHRSNAVHFHIMKHLKYFDPEISFNIAECYFQTYYPFRNDDRFKIEYFLEVAEELGQHRLVPLIKQLVEMLLEELVLSNETGSHARHYLERPMRALVSLALPSDEEWLLERLDRLEYDDGFEFPQLRRAAECLAYAGSVKAIPYLKKIANQHRLDEMILNVCHFAYKQICQREKIPFSGNELFTTEERAN
jgi:hypothetical protein